MTPTLGIVLTLVLGVLILVAVFFLNERTGKADPAAALHAYRRITASQVRRLEAVHADWEKRADYWIAEYDRAHAE